MPPSYEIQACAFRPSSPSLTQPLLDGKIGALAPALAAPRRRPPQPAAAAPVVPTNAVCDAPTASVVQQPPEARQMQHNCHFLACTLCRKVVRDHRGCNCS